MKTFLSFSLILTLLLSGCGPQPSDTDNAPAQSSSVENDTGDDSAGEADDDEQDEQDDN